MNTFLRSCTKLSATLIFALPGATLAGPTNGQVTLGNASIDQNIVGTTNVTQSTERAVIEWGSFNLSADELLLFDQPSNSSVMVNKDMSGFMSNIDGVIGANGQIFILNPSGILFGQNAQVFVGGLVASDLTNAEDIAESGGFDLIDTNVSSGGVTNLGSLQSSGYGIALIGQQVTNNGIIETSTGDAQLLAASEVAVLFEADSTIGFELTEPVRNLIGDSDYLVENQEDGLIVSVDGGNIVYGTRYVEDLLLGDSVSQNGVDVVMGIENQAGDIFIVETPVAETLVETVIDDIVNRDSGAALNDAGETTAKLEETTSQMSEADNFDLEAFAEKVSQAPEESSSSETIASSSSDANTGGSESSSDQSVSVAKNDQNENEEDQSAEVEEEEEDRDVAALAQEFDPSYFLKLRKGNIEDLLPKCQANAGACQQQKAMKEFLGRMLIDGNL